MFLLPRLCILSFTHSLTHSHPPSSLTLSHTFSHIHSFFPSSLLPIFTLPHPHTHSPLHSFSLILINSPSHPHTPSYPLSLILTHFFHSLTQSPIFLPHSPSHPHSPSYSFSLTLTHSLTYSPVVAQDYQTEAENEYVIRGNSVVMKCKIPSFVADFVSVQSWADSEGQTYFPSRDYGTPFSIGLS